MELFIVLLLLGLGYGVRGASDRVRGDLRKSREAKVKEAAKAAGGKLPKHQRAAVARRHTRGWWAREVAGGFPAARTGWHAGWIAHKTALARQQIIREEARTEHAETQTSFRKDLAEHQKRQAAARAELERELAAQQAKGSPATGKSAVEKAADEVSRKREEKAARERKTHAGDHWAGVRGDGTRTPINWRRDSDGREYAEIPDGVGYDSILETARQHGALERHTGRLYRGASIDPDTGQIVMPAHPVVIDTPVRVHNAEDSSWLRPGEPRCEGCGGRGGLPGGTCPACRGFGSAPADPDSPVAADNAICGACGHGQRPGDPVLAAEGGYLIHRSHATEQTGAYQDALGQMRHAEGEPGPDAATWKADIREEDQDDRHAEIDDAVIAADHGFEGEFELPASPTTTEGAPVTDTNYTAVLNAANARAAEAEQDAALIGIRLQTAFTDADGMQAAKVDSATLSAQSELIDRLSHAKSAVDAVGEQAAVVAQTVQRGHGGIQEAVNDAPIAQPAQPEFYAGG